MEHQLEEISEALGLPLDDEQRERLLAYLALLARWNATYNLTSIRDPESMLVQHIADCLAVVDPIRKMLPKQALDVVDVGSGGGLPGVVLAIVEPAWRVVCVDAVGKKTAFVRQVAAELGLVHLTAEHERVERWAKAADLVVSRAFASLRSLTELTRHLVRCDGVWMAMKGQLPTDEIAELPKWVNVFHVEQLVVPQTSAERCLVWLKPVDSQAGLRR